MRPRDPSALKIAVANWSSRLAGGLETYLDTVLPALGRRGPRLALWHEIDEPAARAAVRAPEGAPRWCAAHLGMDAAIAALAAWRPDVLYVHTLREPATESRLLALAPAVLFTHGYHGTCVSGTKTRSFPHPLPCTRRFGPACLLQYYPRRCGGLSPLTLFREYLRQSRRGALLHRYRAVVTGSDWMRRELRRHGVAAERIHHVPYPPAADLTPRDRAEALGLALPARPDEPWRLLFVGRMDPLKGGPSLLAALPRAASELRRPLEVRFAGDGPDFARCARLAAALERRHPALRIELLRWVGREALEPLLAAAHLLVVPSLWPEPFGLVGPEAGLFGVPAAAFAVGGIPEWLRDGENGHLAPGDPPRSRALAAAIVRCLSDPDHYRNLRRGAWESARRLSLERHVGELLAIFARESSGEVLGAS